MVASDEINMITLETYKKLDSEKNYLESELVRLKKRLVELKDPLFYKELPPQIAFSRSENCYSYGLHCATAYYYHNITTKYDKTNGFGKKTQFDNLDSVIIETIQRQYYGDLLQIRTKQRKNNFEFEYAAFISHISI